MSEELIVDLWRAAVALLVAVLTGLTFRLRSRISQDSSSGMDDIDSDLSESSRVRRAAIWRWLLPRIRKAHSQWSHSERDEPGETHGKQQTKR